jgi:hypothetical protein
MSAPLEQAEETKAATQAGAAAVRKGVAGRAMALLKRYKTVIQVIVFALIALFVGAAIYKSWAQIARYEWHVHWGLLAGAFGLLVAQELTYALIWRSILVRMGSRLGIIWSERIYLGSEFVRYIPGNVWHVITRVLWAERRGVAKPVGLASMVVELATKITSAALVFAVSLFFWADTHALTTVVPRGVLITAGALLVPLLLFGLHPRVLQGTLNFGLRKLGREPVSFTLSYLDILVITLYWALSWLVAGAGFYLLVRAFTPAPLTATAVALAIGIYAIGWDIGFVSFVTPSGIGFREVTIGLLLSFSGLVPLAAGAAVLTVIAFGARLLSTGAELVCIGAAHAIRAEPRPVPTAEAAKRA